jgi:hypothetical protein
MTKLSEDLVQTMCDMINAGRVSPQTLMEELGVAQSSVSRWSTHGNHLLELHDGDRDATLTDIRTTFTKGDMKYAMGCVKFVTDVPAAFAELRGRLEIVAVEGGLNDPKIAIDILSRWDPPHWAKQLQVKQEIETRQVVTKVVVHRGEEPKQLESQYPINAEFVEIDNGK